MTGPINDLVKGVAQSNEIQMKILDQLKKMNAREEQRDVKNDQGAAAKDSIGPVTLGPGRTPGPNVVPADTGARAARSTPAKEAPKKPTPGGSGSEVRDSGTPRRITRGGSGMSPRKRTVPTSSLKQGNGNLPHRDVVAHGGEDDGDLSGTRGGLKDPARLENDKYLRPLAGDETGRAMLARELRSMCDDFYKRKESDCG